MVPQPPRSKLLEFGLFRVRSPLLAESRLISFPPGTEMFQFPGLAPLRVTGLATSRVSPFGHPEITGSVHLPQAFRSLARPSSPLDAKAFTVCFILFDPKILKCDSWPRCQLPTQIGVDPLLLTTSSSPSIVKERLPERE